MCILDFKRAKDLKKKRLGGGGWRGRGVGVSKLRFKKVVRIQKRRKCQEMWEKRDWFPCFNRAEMLYYVFPPSHLPHKYLHCGEEKKCDCAFFTDKRATENHKEAVKKKAGNDKGRDMLSQVQRRAWCSLVLFCVPEKYSMNIR